MANNDFDADIPKIVLDEEDRSAYQRARQNQQKGAKPAPPEADKKTEHSGGSSTLTWFAFLIALAATGASYWLYTVSETQRLQLSRAEQRLQDLEQQLAVTDEELGESAGALQSRVTTLTEKTDELWDQMDKLWASAWRRNQTEIKDLNATVVQRTTAIDGRLETLESANATRTTSMNNMLEQVQRHSQRLTELAEMLAGVQQNDADHNIQIADLRDKVQSAQQVTGNLRNELARLAQQVRSNTPDAPTPLPQPKPVQNNNPTQL